MTSVRTASQTDQQSGLLHSDSLLDWLAFRTPAQTQRQTDVDFILRGPNGMILLVELKRTSGPVIDEVGFGTNEKSSAYLTPVRSVEPARFAHTCTVEPHGIFSTSENYFARYSYREALDLAVADSFSATSPDTGYSSITSADPLDISVRLNELRELEEGWADGTQSATDWGNNYGEALNDDGLQWLESQFQSFYHLASPPHLYPTPDGNIQAEWTLGQFEISLEIDFSTHSAQWHCLNLSTRIPEIEELDLNDPDKWYWISNKIRSLESE